MFAASPTLCPEKLSTTKPDLKRLSPFASCISKDSASLSNNESAVRDSTVSSLSLSLPISLIVNLCVLYLFTFTSFGEKVNAGINIVASFIPSDTSDGSTGFSADTPSTILKSPSLVRNKDANLER